MGCLGGAGLPGLYAGGCLCRLCGSLPAFPARFPRFDPLPPTRSENEIMPEPSRGWGTWIVRLGKRVCMAGWEKVAKGRELLQLLPNWGGGDVGAEASL